MTENVDRGIGKRLASYRKFLGFNSSSELAEGIPNDRITASVIQNIESGRKSDLTVAQLLDISHTLGISPMLLLAPIGRPFDLIDLPNVGEGISNMSVYAFESWLSMSEATVPGEAPKQAHLRYIYRTVRRLVAEVDDWRRYSVDSDLEVEPFEYENEDGQLESYDPRSWALLKLSDSERSIDALYNQLSQANVDLSWVPRPWHKEPSDG